MELKIVLEEQEEGGYTVFVPALPGCISEGDTLEEAINNIKEAIILYLDIDTIDFSGKGKIIDIQI
ncbi:MAG: type II toxin-antitoxin system HicB family antitoxin [Nanoarchaeota archaeon]|nr:type II toxin-antitoxin system HicB family antitoxin [Nanoarchaeota archaeon]